MITGRQVPADQAFLIGLRRRPARRQIDSQPAIGYINCAETPPRRFSLPEACMLEIVTTR